MRLLAILSALTLCVSSPRAQEEMPGADSSFAVPEFFTLSSDSLFLGWGLDSRGLFVPDSLRAPGGGRARIVRDDHGVPHVYGRTDRDVAFGFGYAQAQDHLEAMLLSFRIARGEAAEILGEAYVESDFKAKLWRVDRVAGERYGSLDERTRTFVGAFVDGINHYIDVHRPWLPDWISPARPTDVIASTRWLSIQMAEQQGRDELSKIGLVPSSRATVGSNQVVVTPKRSASGHPLAMMDPHLDWEIPNRLYEAHLVSDEGMNVYGATFFGWPVIVFGHNAVASWSFTANDIDIFDLYELKLDPANDRRYLFEREKQRISERRVTIKVLRDGVVTETSRDLMYSHHGPIYKMMKEWAYAARTTAEDVVDAVGQLYSVNRSHDLQDFRSAMARLQIPMFNVMYADTSGAAFYAFQGRVPIRSLKFDWRSPVPGWTEETAWGGIVPFSQLPQVFDPPAGFLQNCNTPPDAVTVEGGIERENFPAHLGWGEMNDRGRRALNWLRARPVVRVDDLVALSRDEYLLEAEPMKGLILGAYNARWRDVYDPESHVAQAIELLRNWDNRADVDSRATLLFGEWVQRFRPMAARLPEDERERIDVMGSIALEALLRTVAYMTEAYGGVDVRWGDVHGVVRGETRYEIGGPPEGIEAMHRTWSRRTDLGFREVVGGSAFTCVVELGETPRAWTLLPFGNTENVISPHYDDQAARQAEGRLKPARFTLSDVVSRAESVVTVPLSPRDANQSAVNLSNRLRMIRGEASDSTMVDSLGDPE